MSVYSTAPVKNDKGGEKPANKTTTTTNPNGTTTQKITYGVVSDFYYQNRGKLFDSESGQYLSAADFHKKMISGAAGVVYNTLLLITVEGKVAQISLNAGRITASTVSLAADDVNVLSSLGISVTATLLKPSFASYKFTNPTLDNTSKKLLSSVDPTERLVGEAIQGWTNFGVSLHKKYHHLPAIKFGTPDVKGHVPMQITYPFVGLQLVEAGGTKKIAKSIVPGYKHHYEPWANGHGEQNQSHLEINNYNPTNPENVASTNGVATNFGIQRNTVLQKNLVDNVRLAPRLLGPKPKSELQQLEGFIAEFDTKKAKDIWIQRLDRIFQPEAYASYDKAITALKQLKAKEKKSGFEKVTSGVVDLVYEVVIKDIVKSIAKIGKGYSGSQKLASGIDYNNTVINQLAKYKTDLEAAGGQFIIEPNGNFMVKTPVKKEQQAELTTTQLVTTTSVNSGTTGTSSTTTTINYTNYTNLKNNEAAIRELVKDANRTAATEAYVNFKKENKELIKGKWNKDILPLFYTTNPKYAPASWLHQRQVNIGRQAVHNFYGSKKGSSLRDF
jgi:hypothetical protein